ncbi:uncharacterized protein [Porites lutea]|uniref:uncharacterized protein n=1 Tax=Porites lutea TaxID=51062 RepID=UPI003CC65D9A
MEKGQRNQKKSTSGRRRRTTYGYDDLKSNVDEEVREQFVPVPKHLIGSVIGKKGSTIKPIKMQSGARITTQDQADAGQHVGFMVCGTQEQINCAVKLINEKLIQPVGKKTTTGRRHASPGQLVNIPSQFQRVVNGPGGDNLRNVSTVSGAEVTAVDAGRKLYVTGDNKKVQHAEYLLRSKVAAYRFKAQRICVYIDERNLPEDGELKLSLVEGNARAVLPRAQLQYRLKPAYGYELPCQGASKLNQESSYDDSLKERALLSLQEIKKEIDARSFHKADMWCHFGTVIIRDPDEADVENTWSIDEILKKVQSTSTRRNEWRVAFKEGVEISERVIQDTFGQQDEQDYIARYDLSYLTPRSQPIRCKVWVARMGIGKKLDEIPIPFSDVKNIVEELCFEDELTRSRCRGWLVLQSKKFLQADIIFPGCNIDCRVSIRALTEDAFLEANGVHEREATTLLSQYLSKLKFTDAQGLVLPREKLPQGYLFNHRRCSKRTRYTPRPGFSMIVSREVTWISDGNKEETRNTTDIHLHCDEWDEALSGEDWEPEMIVAKLPEFLNFVRDVQDFISFNHK